MTSGSDSVLALDYGDKRVGLALASVDAKIASPLTTLINDQSLLEKIKQLIQEHHIHQLVVGYPRNLSGEATEQTKVVERFVAGLGDQLKLPVALQDEALSSKRAEAELDKRGKVYDKTEIDALAASLILEDWLLSHS